MNIKNKVIVITGASGGLGEEIAICLSRFGAETILVARSNECLEKVASKIFEITKKNPLIVPCDVSSEDDVNNMVTAIRKKYSHVDVLINNAGIGKYIPSQEMTNHEMRNHFAVNVFGAFYCIKAILPLMKVSADAYILNVASLFSLISFADVSVYAATKFALAGFTKGLRQELKEEKIDVGLLMPASINTPFQEKKIGNRKTPEFMILESQKVAYEISAMIRKKKKELILPKWIAPFVKIKCAIG